MRYIISILFILSVSAFAMGQQLFEADSVGLMCKAENWNNNWKMKDYRWKVKDHRLKPAKLYSETSSQDVIIQNSYPKGGSYMDLNGENFGYSIFWTRLINETDAPLELTMSFDAYTIFPSGDSFLKLFLPQDTMTFAKTVVYDYGVDLKSFLDISFHSPTMLQKIIEPDEEYFFNIGSLFHQGDGVVRAELVIKGQDIFYKINGTDSRLDLLIPCGRIEIKR